MISKQRVLGMAKNMKKSIGLIEERVEEVQSELNKEMDLVKATLGAIQDKMPIMERMEQMLLKLDGSDSGDAS